MQPSLLQCILFLEYIPVTVVPWQILLSREMTGVLVVVDTTSSQLQLQLADRLTSLASWTFCHTMLYRTRLWGGRLILSGQPYGRVPLENAVLRNLTWPGCCNIIYDTSYFLLKGFLLWYIINCYYITLRKTNGSATYNILKEKCTNLKHDDINLPPRVWYGIMGDMATNYTLSYMKFSTFPLRDNLELGTFVGNVRTEGGGDN
jgi:hypothetical protein